MSAPHTYFAQLCGELCRVDSHIKPGKMMSSPALKYRDKVFVFFSKDEQMVFKLGKQFVPHEFDSTSIQAFNPFKNKGPLSGWFQVHFEEKELWEPLSRMALAVIQQT